jgi:hypothetical protein
MVEDLNAPDAPNIWAKPLKILIPRHGKKQNRKWTDTLLTNKYTYWSRQTLEAQE